MAKKLELFTSCVSDEAAIFSIARHSNLYVCPLTWRRMTRDLLVQMAYHSRRTLSECFSFITLHYARERKAGHFFVTILLPQETLE